MKILVVENNNVTFGFRKELVDTLIENGNEIGVVGDFDSITKEEYSSKLKFYKTKTELKSKNIIKNLSLISNYKKIIKEFNPDLLLTFTIKPNIYCNIAKKDCVSIANITGLGNSFNKNGLLKKIVVFLYKKSFKKVDHIMFQNVGGLNVFKENKIPLNCYSIIPGSGVNAEKFILSPLDKHDGVTFLYPSRLIERKGFYVLLSAIPEVLKKHPETHFVFLGRADDRVKKEVAKLDQDEQSHLSFYKFTNDVLEHYQKCDFVVSPSFYNEGISNVLLEGLACGRPIITTNDNCGCKEVLQEGINGFGVKSQDVQDLINVLNKAAELDKKQIEKMGIVGREFVVKNFNRKTTIQIYLDIIDKLIKK